METHRAVLMADLTIANTVTDLIQGDVNEHLAFERIPLKGDVLGLGTTTSVDNGELTFLPDPSGDTAIWKCEAFNGGIRKLQRGDGSSHFPYVCFSTDATGARRPVEIAQLGSIRGVRLQELVAKAIHLGREAGSLEEAPVYGVRLLAEWQELVITVASKLCMGQQRRNSAIASNPGGDATNSKSIYDLLQHYRLGSHDPGKPEDPVQFLGQSLHWECCGFFDTNPELGRVTIPAADAHLHLHGCSTDLRYGGHLHHEHPSTQLARLERLVLYPLHAIQTWSSDLIVQHLAYQDGCIQFTVANQGQLDVSDVGIAVVVNNRYSDHRYLRLPWMEAGGSERFSMAWSLASGDHVVEVVVDPEQQILEPEVLRENNRASLKVTC